MKKLFISMLDLMSIDEEILLKRLEVAGFDLNRPISTTQEIDGNTYYQEEPRMMNLKDFLNLQAGLDRVIMDRLQETGQDIKTRELLNSKMLAMFSEMAEYIQEESSFKYWKQNHKVDEEKALVEFADIFFFWLSIANLKGYTAAQIEEAYMKKWNENIRRQKNNY